MTYRDGHARREARIRAQDASEQSGMSDSEWRTFKREKSQPKPSEDSGRMTLEERAERLKKNELGIDWIELARVYERAVVMLEGTPEDSRDKTALRDAMKMLFDAAKSHRGDEQEDPLKENMEYWVDSVQKSYDAEAKSATPEKMKAMAAWDCEHAGRVLEREREPEEA